MGTRELDDMAARQWAEWRASRRHLLKIGAFAGGTAALGGLSSAPPFVRIASAQEATPRAGGTVNMGIVADV